MIRRYRVVLGLLGILVLIATGLSIRYAQPRSSEEMRYVAVGRHWFDPFDRNLRLFSVAGDLQGQYWLDVPNIRAISYSPDGRWLSVRYIGEGPDHQFSTRLVRVDQLQGGQLDLKGVWSVDWSPDQSQIAITTDTWPGRQADQGYAIVTADASCLESGHECLADGTVLALGSGGSWSPDGSKFVYASTAGRVVVMRTSDRVESPISEMQRGECGGAQWSPSGRYIVYDCSYQMIIFDMQSGLEREISPLQIGFQYEWLPGSDDELVVLGCERADGLCQSHFLWNEEADITQALYLVSAEGETIRRIIPSNDESIHFFAIWPALK